MAREDKTWSFTPFLLSRDNQVRCHGKTNHGHSHLPCHPETIKSDSTQRQNMVTRTLFTIQTQSSPTWCRDKSWSSKPFSQSRDNQFRWHVETKHGHPHLFCNQETLQSDGTWRQTWSSAPSLSSKDNQFQWHAETKHGHPHRFGHQETIMSDASRTQKWSSAPSLPSRDDHVWSNVETKKGHPHPFCYLETIKSDGTQRQNMVIWSLFAIQRQSSQMARGDTTWSSTPFLLSKDNQVRWHVETIMVIRTLFAIQRQSSLMARAEETWSSAPFLLSRDNQVRWHAETKHGHPTFCNPEAIKSDGT